MSLAIQVDNVTDVLLADGWHKVGCSKDGVSSFDTDAYEFLEGERLLVGGGTVAGIPSTGATWCEKTSTGKFIVVVCPLTSILALRVKR